MVNGSLPRTTAHFGTHKKGAKHRVFILRRVFRCATKSIRPRLSKILGKFYFFKFGEIFRLILLDYEKKHRRIANATFKGAC